MVKSLIPALPHTEKSINSTNFINLTREMNGVVWNVVLRYLTGSSLKAGSQYEGG